MKESITDCINDAFKKMKLGKKKNYHWRLSPDSQNFVGVYNPPKPKPAGIKGLEINQPPISGRGE